MRLCELLRRCQKGPPHKSPQDYGRNTTGDGALQRTLFLAILLSTMAVSLFMHDQTTAHAQSGLTTYDVVDLIDLHAAPYGEYIHYIMHEVAWCESKYHPYRIGARGEVGPFQFLPVGGVWGYTDYGRRGIRPDWVSVEEQIRWAAWLMASGYLSHWTCAYTLGLI